MEQDKSINEQIYKCCIIHELIESDVRLFDSDKLCIFNIANTDLYPEYFKLHIKQTVAGFLDSLQDEENNTAFYFNAEFMLCFLGMRFQHSYIIIGPFLEEEFSFSLFVSKHSSMLAKMGATDKILYFFKSLKVMQFGKSDKLSILCCSLFTNELPKVDIHYSEHPPKKRKDSSATNLDEESSSYWVLYREYEKKLNKSIVENDLDKTMEVLEQMKLIYSSLSGLRSIQRIREILTMLNSNLARNCIENNVPSMISYTISAHFGEQIDKISNLSEYNAILLELFREYYEIGNKYKDMKYSNLVSQAVEYINQNIQRQFTLKDISKKLHVSNEHLSRCFKQETGSTITHYIHKAKIDTAVKLMEKKEQSLLEISHIIGYSNYSHFQRWFKRFMGVTPKDYTSR